MLQKLVMPEWDGDAGVKTGQIFRIAIGLFDMREAPKNYINVAQLVMPNSEGDSGVKSE